MRRTYVQVICSHLENGAVIPMEIHWNDGRKWKIKRVIHSCGSPDGEYEGIRYTVLINRSTRYLYQLGDMWYVETIEGNT